MQGIFSAVRTLMSRTIYCSHLNLQQTFTTFQKPASNKLLVASTPVFNSACNFKVKGRVRRRCKSCYLVVRDQRIYNICPKYPRHKQMAMKAKPLTTYILTHATQSPVRPW